MNNSLTHPSALTLSQPLSKPPTRDASARDGGGLHAPRQDKTRREEFLLPPEPRDRGVPAQTSRTSFDQSRRPGDRRRESQGLESVGESDARREDVPRRSDQPRGGERPHDGEPPCRSDPPRRSGRTAENTPPRREDPPGFTRSERGSSGEAVKVSGTEPQAVVRETNPEADLDGIIQIPDNGAAPPDATVDPEGQASSVSAHAPLDAESTTGEAHVQLTPFSDAAAPSPDLRPVAASDSEPQVAATHGSDPHENDEQECGHGRDAREDEVRPASGAASPLPVQVPATTEKATVAVSPSAALSGDQSQPTTPPERSAPVERVGTIGAQGASAHQEHAPVGERGEPAGPSLRSDAPTEALNETSGSAPGTEAKPAPKADQAWLSSSSASSGAPPRVPPVETPVPNAPIRVVSEVPLGAVPVEIGLKSLAGVNHFEIRLDPAELGRIEVRLEIDAEGGVKAHLSVDRVETLALLQRDAKTLERAFDQAGLKLSDGSIDLSLRDQHAQGQGRHEHAGDERRDGSRRPAPDIRHEHADPALAEAPRRLWRGVAGIDVRI